jgi:hypothetical protein
MRKFAIALSIAIYTIVSINMISSSSSYAAFPISKTTTASAQEIILEKEISAITTSTTTKAVTKIKTEKKKNFFSRMVAKLGGSKSQVVALILCIFLGGLGIHRFYLGYTWQGIVQLLTAGGCGIWALIDLIRIITGDLQPKDGSYDKTL